VAQGSTLGLWVVLGAGVALGLGLYLKSLQSQVGSLRSKLDREVTNCKLLQEHINQLQIKLNKTIATKNDLSYQVEALQSLIDEKASLFPWLSIAKNEIKDIFAARSAKYLETKKHPAKKSAEIVREIRARARDVEKTLHRLRYRQHYCEYLFPWLSDLFDEDIESLIAQSERQNNIVEPGGNDDVDPVLNYLSPVEFNSKTPAERNQKALERYVFGRKTKWQIGRDFERCVGYLLEAEGFRVQYHGALEGFEDLGRDLIAHRNEETLIVQCKCWSSDRPIHEKHIYQLYGTFCDYAISNNIKTRERQRELFNGAHALQNISAVFFTTAQLSPRAREAADLLGIDVRDSYPSNWDYPRVKCNVSRRDGKRIYHLPFDQQYDRILIEPERGEFFATTCQEAEERDFRRAWRWRPTDND